MALARNLRETATHWTVTPDVYGGYTYSAPATIACRWEDKSELFRDPMGEEVVSNAIVYLASEVSPGDFLYLGTSVAADPVATHGSDAQRVKQYNEVPDLRNIQRIRKAFL